MRPGARQGERRWAVPRTEPLIVTLLVDPDSQAHFDRLRREHFPPERNVIAAHVTLFHALPGARQAQVTAALAAACRREAFPVGVAGVRFLGRGVAYALRSAELLRLRSELAAGWLPDLTRQDAARWSPHITVANKLPPQPARELADRLSASFVPRQIQARGLALWRYLGGPWEAVSRVAFGIEEPAAIGEPAASGDPSATGDAAALLDVSDIGDP